jgi:hypothetical protein
MTGRHGASDESHVAASIDDLHRDRLGASPSWDQGTLTGRRQRSAHFQKGRKVGVGIFPDLEKLEVGSPGVRRFPGLRVETSQGPVSERPLHASLPGRGQAVHKVAIYVQGFSGPGPPSRERARVSLE